MPLRSCTLPRLSISLLLALCSLLQAAPNSATPQLEILERRAELTPLLSVSQKITLLKLEEQIEHAQSQLQTGQYLKQTRPSKLNPNENVQATIQRGEQMIARAQVELSQAQTEIAQLLQQVETERQQALNAEIRHSLKLPQADLPAALQQAAEQIINACQAAGYQDLLFDRVFDYGAPETPTAAPADLNEQTYQALVTADGENYAVLRAQDLELSSDENEPTTYQFSYRGDRRKKNKSVALIAVEIMAASEPSAQLIYFRALDVKSFRIISQSLIEVVDPAEEVPKTRASLIVRGPWLSQLAQLQPAYNFKLATVDATADAQWSRQQALCTQLILEHSTLPIIDEAFVLRAYGPAEETELGRANAVLQLSPGTAAAPNTFSLRAQADSSPRILEIGDFVLE